MHAKYCARSSEHAQYCEKEPSKSLRLGDALCELSCTSSESLYVSSGLKVISHIMLKGFFDFVNLLSFYFFPKKFFCASRPLIPRQSKSFGLCSQNGSIFAWVMNQS